MAKPASAPPAVLTVAEARAAYDADKSPANSEALDRAVEAFHLDALSRKKGEIGKAARKRLG